MTIRDTFIAFALKYNITLNESNQDILSFYISGEKGKYNSFAMYMEDEKIFAYFVD